MKNLSWLAVSIPWQRVLFSLSPLYDRGFYIEKLINCVRVKRKKGRFYEK